MGNTILGDSSLSVAAVLTQLSIEAAGSSRHVIQRLVNGGRNILREKTIVSQGLGGTFCLFAVWKTQGNHQSESSKLRSACKSSKERKKWSIVAFC